MITHRAEILEEIERRRLSLSMALVRVYNYYRALVGLALLTVFSQSVLPSRLGALAPELFVTVTIAYVVFNLITALTVQLLPERAFTNQYPAIGLVAFDTLTLTWLMYLSGGVASGLGVLVLVSVATGAIIVVGPRFTLLPALATIAVLYEEFYLSLSAPDLHDDYFQAGILGTYYFAIAFGIQNLSQRIRDSDVRALTQAAELADMERVNRQIVMRMQTGILLVDQSNQVRMANQSARALLGQIQDDQFTQLPAPLTASLTAWRADNHLRIPPQQISEETPEIRVAYSAVREDDPQGDVTIFIEDTGELQQQAQQLKLASLGRLSASIAHEIRNPLGAISHAAQLLQESQILDEGDLRLTSIIHEHCLRMNGVIENVLEMSRRKPPSPTKIRLDNYLADFSDGFKETQQDAAIDIQVDPSDTEVRIDTRQFGQILTNLVSNGIRYSRETGGEPFVGLEGGVDPRTERPFLNVIDRGPGVPADATAKLFDPFFTTSNFGTGLGLYISRELCEANQARLTYHSHDAGGSCFRITFAHPERLLAS